MAMTTTVETTETGVGVVGVLKVLGVRRHGRPQKAGGGATASSGAIASSPPAMLVAQRDRDHEGHGVSLRPVAEATYQEIYQSTLTSTKLSRTLTQLAVSFDRLLSDERRCDAYRCAIDRAIHSGARTFAVLGVGSLLPALHAARCGAHVAVGEPVEPLAQLIRNGAAANGLRLAVVSSCEKLRSAWGGEPPDALLSERIDESLLSEGLLPSLRAAVNAFGGRVPSHGVLPSNAVLTACPVQLGFENVGGFGLDGLDIDLRHFDALRPSGVFAQQAPGYWPVRLLPARQPHARLGEAFVAARLDFAKLSVSSGSSVMSATHDVVMTRDGLLNAVVFWFDLHVYKQQQSSQQQDECCASSGPPDLGSRGGVAGGWSEGWKQAACYLASPRYVKKGEGANQRVPLLHGRRYGTQRRLSQGDRESRRPHCHLFRRRLLIHRHWSWHGSSRPDSKACGSDVVGSHRDERCAKRDGKANSRSKRCRRERLFRRLLLCHHGRVGGCRAVAQVRNKASPPNSRHTPLRRRAGRRGAAAARRWRARRPGSWRSATAVAGMLHLGRR